MSKTTFNLEEIKAILPHRPPFLFVDEVIGITPNRSITATYFLNPDSPWFVGHFPGHPIMPGVLTTDALAQTSGLLWGFSKIIAGEKASEKPTIFFLAASSMKFHAPAHPSETLRLSSVVTKSFDRLFLYSVEAFAGKRLIASGTLTLSMMEGLS